MNNTVIIILFIMLSIMIIKSYSATYFEHMTTDEAIKNVASLYNTSKLITTNMTSTDTVDTQKIKLGTKWLLSGNGDAHGNDDWLRIMGQNGQYYGGVAAGKLWVSNAYNQDVGSALNDLNSKSNDLTDKVNNAQVKGQQDIKRFPGKRATDGWDIMSDFQVSGFDDCINRCKNTGYALVALHREDNRCWCKSLPALGATTDPNWHRGFNTAMFI